MVMNNTYTNPNKRSSPNEKFNGIINLDVCDSKADWPAFLDPKTPEVAPNALVILYDDTGCTAWSTMVSVKEFN
jgi:hypothetical protein